MHKNARRTSRRAAEIISRRLKALGKDAAGLAIACGLSSTELAEMLITGELRIPGELIVPIAGYLDLDPRRLRRALVEEYSSALGLEDLPVLIGPEPTDKATPFVPSPVSGDAVDPKRRIARVTVLDDDEDSISTEHELLLPMLRVRRLFQAMPMGFTAGEAARLLLLKPNEAASLMEDLEDLRYVRHQEEGTSRPEIRSWSLTDRGRKLAARPGPNELDRESAFSILSDLTRHLAVVNAREELAYRVTGMVLIGEVLEALGDNLIPHVEVTMVLSPRHAEQDQQQALNEACLERAQELCHLDGSDFDAHGDAWPIIQVEEAIREAGLHVAIRWYFDE